MAQSRKVKVEEKAEPKNIGVARVTLPKTQKELNEKKLTLDSNAEVKVLAFYRAGNNPLIIPNRELAHYSVSINGVPVFINQKQYDSMFKVKKEKEAENA